MNSWIDIIKARIAKRRRVREDWTRQQHVLFGLARIARQAASARRARESLN